MQIHRRYTREELLNLRVDHDINDNLMGKNRLRAGWFNRLMCLLAQNDFVDAYILCDTVYQTQFLGKPIESRCDIRRFLDTIINVRAEMDKRNVCGSILIEDAMEQLNIILG